MKRPVPGLHKHLASHPAGTAVRQKGQPMIGELKIEGGYQVENINISAPRGRAFLFFLLWVLFLMEEKKVICSSCSDAYV